MTAAGSLQAYRVIEARGGLGSRQGYEMSDANEMRDVGFYAAGASCPPQKLRKGRKRSLVTFCNVRS